MGGPHPSLEKLWELAEPWLPKTGRVYIPACGRAHEGAWFAARGYDVLGEDIVPEAIEAARVAYGHLPNLTFRVGDLYRVSEEDRGAFDLVFDRAACCAFAPTRWEEYLAACSERLRSGGLLLSLPFKESLQEAPKGPPFFIPKADWQKLAGKDFDVRVLVDNPVDRPAISLKTELLAVAQKR